MYDRVEVKFKAKTFPHTVSNYNHDELISLAPTPQESDMSLTYSEE